MLILLEKSKEGEMSVFVNFSVNNVLSMNYFLQSLQVRNNLLTHTHTHSRTNKGNNLLSIIQSRVQIINDLYTGFFFNLKNKFAYEG